MTKQLTQREAILLCKFEITKWENNFNKNTFFDKILFHSQFPYAPPKLSIFYVFLLFLGVSSAGYSRSRPSFEICIILFYGIEIDSWWFLLTN